MPASSSPDNRTQDPGPPRPLFCLPLDSAMATLPRVGGKGANLSLMARAGLPVPGGFLVTTAAYWRFVDDNGLRSWLSGRLADTELDAPPALTALAEAIRHRFGQGQVPPELRDALLTAYRRLGSPPVAVRSSATAEDLPDLSFAGQQDTFLNVMGETAFITAVVDCWSSLWTARAIGYRARNQISHHDVALAVVVQKMVPSDSSGVLFTANPLTGNRTEMSIDATHGLGEALVAGMVEPDHYVVDADSGQIRQQTVGAKATVIRPLPGGGTVTETEEGAGEPALTPEQVTRLVDLGRQLADLFGGPQDVEWAWAGDELHLLQSRPITSLFPLPEEFALDDPLRLLVSFAAIQGVMAPITPLGQDVLKGFFTSGGLLFGVNRTIDSQRALLSAGEYLFVNFTPLFQTRLTLRMFKGALPMIEPAAAQALNTLLADPGLVGPPTPPSWRTRWYAFRLVARMLRRLLLVMARPAAQRRWLQSTADGTVEEYRQAFESAPDLAARLALLRRFTESLVPDFFPTLLPAVAAGIGSIQRLHRLTAHMAGAPDAMLLTGGLPHNVTTEMDLALWQTSRLIQADAEAASLFAAQEATALAHRFLAGKLPLAAQQAVGSFMDTYGMRGLAEIDLGRKRWREDPTPIMQTLQSYLQIDDPERAPDAVFQRSARRAETARLALIEAAHAGRGGAIKGRVVAFLANRARELAGLREAPKFFAVRVLGIIRQALLRSGQELAQAGVLQTADDLFFLRLSELEALAQGQPGEWQQLVAQRRQVYAQAARRSRIPRLLLTDGRAFYEGVQGAAADDDTLVGNPVSPGAATGRVRVVLDPHQTQLRPGEILVCPGTDPAWTPLFLSAAGLVMEVGGLMTHGAVVAREYGIPAVVGVHQATTRLTTGQWVQVDGSGGLVTCLPDPADNGNAS